MRANLLRNVVPAMLVAAGVIMAAHAFPRAAAQNEPLKCGRPPLTLGEVIELVSAGVEDKNIRQHVANCGVDFILDDKERIRLRALGASDALLGALAPPVHPAVGEEWTSPVDRREMVWIEPGTFLMGSPEDEVGRDADEARHSVRIERGFWLDTMPVTYEAYSRFVVTNPAWDKDHVDRRYHDGGYLKDWHGTSYPREKVDWPVTYVSWHAARAYAAWAGKRLPTEAEFEYACRAGSTTRYWWGETFEPARANNGPAIVASRQASHRNPWGLYDMLGNVWEWSSSLYRPYPYTGDDGRESPDSPADRAIRGGSWNQAAVFLRAANRNNASPVTSSDRLGFRCAWSSMGLRQQP
jgi:formylglycine-generating enzyme required for sulfatase activity